MTIAVCYLTPEGVVLGADSTASAVLQSGPGGPSGLGTLSYHYFNHHQKIFQIGEQSSLGVVTWGLSSIGTMSHRTLLAQLADKLKKPPNVLAVAKDWSTLFWPIYS